MKSCSTKLTIEIEREGNDVDTTTDSNMRVQIDVSSSTSPGLQDDQIRKQDDISDSIVHGPQESTPEKPADVTSSGEEKNYSSGDDNAQNQLVVYDPAGAGETEGIHDQPLPLRRFSFQNQASRVLPSVGAFTVQCANCFKWRFIPSKEKYEEIREHILEQPFVCEAAREWRPDISCDDQPDIMQDGSRLWAIDKPSIAQPPLGWERLLRIRAEGGTRFADVYYVAPSGKRLRSTIEIERYLLEHPDEAEGISMSQFSFQIPRPLRENYVRKRPPPARYPSEVDPISWVGPDENTDLRLAPYEPPVYEPLNRPVKRSRATSIKTYTV